MCRLLELMSLSLPRTKFVRWVYTTKGPPIPMYIKTFEQLFSNSILKTKQNTSKTHLNKLLKPRKCQSIPSQEYSTSQGQRLCLLHPQCLEQCLAYSRCSVSICWISQSINIKVNILFLNRHTCSILNETVLTCDISPCTL